MKEINVLEIKERTINKNIKHIFKNKNDYKFDVTAI